MGHERRIRQPLRRQVDPGQRTPPAARVASGSGQKETGGNPDAPKSLSKRRPRTVRRHVFIRSCEFQVVRAEKE